MRFRRPRTKPSDLRFTTLLAASTVGVYLLVLAGASVAMTNGSHSPSTWPFIRGSVVENPMLLIAWGHRLTAAAVGVLVLVTAVVGFRSDPRRRVTAMLAFALVCYPVQIALGGFLATSEASGVLPNVHLAFGMGIFVALVSALAWQLEAETGSTDKGSLLDERGETLPGTPRRNEPTPSDDVPPAANAATPEGSAASDGRRSQDCRFSQKSTESGIERVRSTMYAYYRLTKPKLMWLLCLVAAAGMALAAGSTLSLETVVLTLGGGVLAIGAAATFNHVYERDTDTKMDRTSDRPVATHTVPVRNAFVFGLALAVGAMVLFLRINVLAAALGLAAILYYSVVYTVLLKPNSVQNTVIGGLAGSLPALIGWVAVTGSIGLPALALAGVIFLWTPAHFYNLAIAYKEDYARGGFPMMPVVRGNSETRKQIVFYLGATLVGAGLMGAIAGLGPLYMTTAVLVGGMFLAFVVKLHRERTKRAAFRAFYASNAYLGALLLAIVIDAAVI